MCGGMRAVYAAISRMRLSRLCGTCALVTCGLAAQQKIPSVPKCQSFEGRTWQAALAYLKQERTTLEPACIYDAISILRNDTWSNRYKQEIPIFLQYLDFKNPDAEIAHTVRVGPTDDFYPAADALGSFGDPVIHAIVIPAMQKVIRSEDANKVSRLNAASVYWWIEPHPSTIAFIARAAQGTGDRETGDALAGLAAQMAAGCDKAELDDCKKALHPE